MTFRSEFGIIVEVENIISSLKKGAFLEPKNQKAPLNKKGGEKMCFKESIKEYGIPHPGKEIYIDPGKDYEGGKDIISGVNMKRVGNSICYTISLTGVQGLNLCWNNAYVRSSIAKIYHGDRWAHRIEEREWPPDRWRVR